MVSRRLRCGRCGCQHEQRPPPLRPCSDVFFFSFQLDAFAKLAWSPKARKGQPPSCPWLQVAFLAKLMRASPRERDLPLRFSTSSASRGAGKLPCVAVGGSSCAYVRTRLSDRERVYDALRVCGNRSASQLSLSLSRIKWDSGRERDSEALSTLPYSLVPARHPSSFLPRPCA